MDSLQAHIGPAPLLLPSSVQLTGVIDEYELQIAVAGAQHAKSVYCFRLVNDLYAQGLLSCQEAMNWMVKLDLSVEYPGHHGELWRQFVNTFIGQFFDTMLKAHHLAAAEILRTVARTLHPPPIPPTRPGLMTRLLAALRNEDAR